MFEDLGLTITPLQASLTLGLGLGTVFGILGQLSAFCIRRGIAGKPSERGEAQAIWLSALAIAIIGTQVAITSGLIDFSAHRFLATDLPWLAITTGGLMFGAGMVFTRGCISRLTVLSGSGNLRALSVLVVFAIIAHATQKGVLAPLRIWLGEFTVNLGATTSLAALPGGAIVWTIALVALIAIRVYYSNTSTAKLLMGAGIGLLIPVAWLATGFILQDEFDPITMQSLSFTLPASDTLFWFIASSSIPAGFGAGLLTGVLAGSTATHLSRKQFKWQSFENSPQTLRYISGASLMGVGGVLAGGCTVGAGISGVATLSIAALIALVSIIAGAVFCNLFFTNPVSKSTSRVSTNGDSARTA